MTICSDRETVCNSGSVSLKVIELMLHLHSSQEVYIVTGSRAALRRQRRERLLLELSCAGVLLDVCHVHRHSAGWADHPDKQIGLLNLNSRAQGLFFSATFPVAKMVQIQGRCLIRP